MFPTKPVYNHILIYKLYKNFPKKIDQEQKKVLVLNELPKFYSDRSKIIDEISFLYIGKIVLN